MLMTNQFRIENMILYLWITLTTIRDISGSQTFWIVAPRKEVVSACDFLLWPRTKKSFSSSDFFHLKEFPKSKDIKVFHINMWKFLKSKLDINVFNSHVKNTCLLLKSFVYMKVSNLWKCLDHLWCMLHFGKKEANCMWKYGIYMWRSKVHFHLYEQKTPTQDLKKNNYIKISMYMWNYSIFNIHDFPIWKWIIK